MSSTTEQAERPPRQARKGQARSPLREFMTAVRNWATVLGFLMAQQLGQRARGGKLSTLFMLAEPLLFIAMIYIIRGVVRELDVRYGTSLLLFLVSGFIPYFMFVRTSARGRAAQLRTRPQLPRINALDNFIAATIVTAMIWIVALVAMFFGMWLYGIEQARPASIAQCGTALALLVLLAVGVAQINAAIARFFPAWLLIYSVATRGMVFFSGVLHVADFYPLRVREWVVWNPLVHAIDLFRLGVYGRYPVLTMDEMYLVKCVVILLFIGFVAERATLRYSGK